MVEKLASFSQWEKYSRTKRIRNNFLGCLEERLGSSFRPLTNRRMLVPRGANPAYKYPGTSSSFFSKKSLVTQNRQATYSVRKNQTAVTYINKLGGTDSHQLSLLAIEFWYFALKRNLTLSAVYVPGIKSHIADKKSRAFKDSLEWMLNPQVFQQILLRIHWTEVDLFASRINHQLTTFVTWRPETGAMACDAFNLNWGLLKGYLSHNFA